MGDDKDKSKGKDNDSKTDGNSKSTICQGCGVEFPSRSAVFRHLKDTKGACLSAEEHAEFQQYLLESERHKVLLLYGYHQMDGKEAGERLLEAIGVPQQSQHNQTQLQIHRSYGNVDRRTELVQQDEGTAGAASEVLTCRLPTLLQDTEEWIDEINQKLIEQSGEVSRQTIILMGRYDLVGGNKKASNFNAELDLTHRKVDYVLPADFLYWDGILDHLPNRRSFFDSLPQFSEHSEYKVHRGRDKPANPTIQLLHKFKRLMQSLTTRPEKLTPEETQKWQEQQEQKFKGDDDDGPRKPKRLKRHEKGKKAKEPKQHLLRRRRFHNFTPKCMAHEFLAFRRMDRLFHKATIRYPEPHLSGDVAVPSDSTRPFVVLSLTGDLFLTGQVQRVLGVFLALARGLVDPEIVDCLFDETYGHLVPTPPVPAFGMCGAEAFYISWEGKLKAILSPRLSNQYPLGWGNERTVARFTKWRDELRRRTAQAWMEGGWNPEDGRLNLEREWTENVLEPWARKAQEQLREYKEWKQAVSGYADETKDDTSTRLIPSLNLVDATVPSLYETVLKHLRQADASGLWPTTSLKRQLVMISTDASGRENKKDEAERVLLPDTLEGAYERARMNKGERSSAYGFAQGEGGASGSFSVGAMPGEKCIQPKGNELFPELMKAAFELEIALRPDREPSSTIAINRNAQFRPHVDSGAGAGQSTSLIVGLGTYAGGELVVEGDKQDIRYRAIEFNGWKQRHWTMPFRGERFSLVWFTPKGCEGVHGIDLCQTSAMA